MPHPVEHEPVQEPVSKSRCSIVAGGLFPYDPRLRKRAMVILAVLTLGIAIRIMAGGLLAKLGFCVAIISAVIYPFLTRERPRGGIE